mgnify:CR=1 FL=1
MHFADLALGATVEVPTLTGSHRLRIPAGTGLVGSCARTRRLINVPDCYADPRFDPALDRQLGDFPVDIVLGHLGYMRTDKGIDAPGFQALLRLVKSGACWVKLTGPMRISTAALTRPSPPAVLRR